MENQMTGNRPENRDESLKKLSKMIDDIEYAMMTTMDSSGKMHSRPMASRKIDADGNLWFLTGKSTHKVTEIGQHSQVNLGYAKPGDNRYVSVSGKAEVFDDKPKAKDLWNPVYRAWFPKGLDDPDLAVMKVSIEEAEYWDGTKRAAFFVL